MALYSRMMAHESRASDEVFSYLRAYPDGVTVRELMRDHQNRLKDTNTVLAAIDLLEEEGKIRQEKSPGQEHYLDSVKVWPVERPIDPARLNEDWEGNNIAVTCPNPECRKVFIVSGRMHRKGRMCPKCGQSRGIVSAKGGRKSEGTASVIWPAS